MRHWDFPVTFQGKFIPHLLSKPMPQAPRPVIRPNTYYHVYNRGVNRRTIFKDDGDYLRFLKLIKKYVHPVAETLSYALMPNHFHLAVLMKPAAAIPPTLLRTPQTLGRTFGLVENAYANYFNYRHKTVSGLFETSFERAEVTTVEYLRNLIVYHHRNPEKHGLEIDFRNYLWTSYQELSNPVVDTYVTKELTISKFGGLEAFFTAHQRDIPNAMADFGFGGDRD